MRPLDGVRKYQLIIAILFLVACIGYLIAVHALGIETEVMRDRFWKNAEPLFNGELPVMEYPPFALVFFAIPRFFGDTPWTYNIAYVAEVFVFMVIGLILVSKLAERMGHDQKKAMLVYAVLTLLMLEFVVDRYDIFPAVLTLASFYLFATKRYAWAGIILAVATLTKLYPAVVFPLYFLYLAYNRQWRDALSATIGFFGAGVLIVAVVWLIEPQMITNFLSYHTDRPLQIESVPSSILYLLSMLGVITLGGTAVNNGIILFDYTNMTLKRKRMAAIEEKYAIKADEDTVLYGRLDYATERRILAESIIESAMNRLKSILMTTLTTMMGVVPMSLATGEGSEIYASLGQAIAGGLFATTVISLFVLPVIYYTLERRKIRRAYGKGRRDAKSMEVAR